MTTPNKYSPQTNTKVLKDAGYKFQKDTYKPREYIQTLRGYWIRAEEK